MLRKKNLLLVLLLLSTAAVNAQAPKYSNEFLSIGVGARALSMSGAQVAITNDVYSGYWNPAGLAHFNNGLQLAGMHSEYFAGIAKYDYGSFAAPIDATNTIGLSVIRFAIDDIIDSTDLIDKDGNINYDKLKTFSAADYAFLLSFARKMKITGLLVGGNVKIIHRKAGDFAKAWGFGFDIGAQYEKGPWSFGAVGKDITSTFNAWSYNTENLKDVFAQTGNEIPENGLEITLPRLIAGASYKTNLSKDFILTPELDLDFTFDGKRNVLIKSNPISIDPKLGFELGCYDLVSVRAGIGNIQQIKNIDQSTSTSVSPNVGVGLHIKNLSVDLALTNFKKSANNLQSLVVSLKLLINQRTNTGVQPK